MNDEKLIRFAKTSYTIVNVLQKIMIVVFALFGLSFGTLLFAWNSGLPGIRNTISLGNVALKLGDETAVAETVLIPNMIITMVGAALMVAIVFYGMSVLKNILRPMKEGRPFDVSVSDGIRKLGYLVLAGGVVRQTVEFVTDRLFLGDFELLRSLFKEGAVEGISYQFHFSLSFIFVAIILFLLARVFRYGEELQRQSDETL